MLNTINYKLLWKQKMALLEANRLLNPDGQQNDLSDCLNGLVNLLDGIQDHAVDRLNKPELDVFGWEVINEDSARHLRRDFFCDYDENHVFSFMENGEEYGVSISSFGYDKIVSSAKSRGYLAFVDKLNKYRLICLSTNSELPTWVLAEMLLEDYLL